MFSIKKLRVSYSTEGDDALSPCVHLDYQVNYKHIYMVTCTRIQTQDDIPQTTIWCESFSRSYYEVLQRRHLDHILSVTL